MISDDGYYYSKMISAVIICLKTDIIEYYFKVFFFVECSYFRTFWHSYENLLIFCYFTKYNYTPRKQSDLSDAENCLFIFWLEANSILSSQLLLDLDRQLTSCPVQSIKFLDYFCTWEKIDWINRFILLDVTFYVYFFCL